MLVSMLKHEITGNHSEKRKNTTTYSATTYKGDRPMQQLTKEINLQCKNLQRRKTQQPTKEMELSIVSLRNSI